MYAVSTAPIQEGKISPVRLLEKFVNNRSASTILSSKYGVYLASSVLVGTVTGVGLLTNGFMSRDSLLLFYFAATYFFAYKYGLYPALWSCVLSLFCFDYFGNPTSFHFSPLIGHHSLTFALMFALSAAAAARTNQVRHYANTLEQQVNERTRELAEANNCLQEEIIRRRSIEKTLQTAVQELANSNASLQSFAHIASHDLQEPLKVIQGYVNLLLRRYRGTLDGTADEFMNYILQASKRMESLIRGVLRQSCITNNDKCLTEFNAEEALKDSIANLSEAINSSGAEIIHQNLPRITADKTLIAELFQNLIGNALKFQRNGHVKIKVSATKEDDAWLFSVQDNGIGIETQYQKQIFEMFKRLHSLEKFPGHGLGLSICKAIVDHHGGKIWVESEAGKGSTFKFTIPDLR